MFRLHGPVPHPQSGWVSLLIKNPGAFLHILPMTWVAMLSRRFLDNDFAYWRSWDNQQAVWPGHWTSWTSFVDQWTLGVGWVCLLLLMVAWYRGGRLRWMLFRLSLVFLVFATVVSLLWASVHSSPMDYDSALYGSETNMGGRYLYPAMMAWLVAGFILLLRTQPGEPAGSSRNGGAGRADLPVDQSQPAARPSS